MQRFRCHMQQRKQQRPGAGERCQVERLERPLDGDGTPRLDTLRSHLIARHVHYDGTQWTELSDTRLLPGQSAAIELPWNGSSRIHVWLDIIPDDFYATQVFPRLIGTFPADSEARRLALQAEALANSSGFRLYDTEVHRP